MGVDRDKQKIVAQSGGVNLEIEFFFLTNLDLEILVLMILFSQSEQLSDNVGDISNKLLQVQ